MKSFTGALSSWRGNSAPRAQLRRSSSLYQRDGSGFREASPDAVVEAAHEVIAERFHVGAPMLSSPELIKDYLRLELAPHRRTVFGALHLDRLSRFIAFTELFHGTVDALSIHPREVMREALYYNASLIILARNDPSGDATPTDSDKQAYQALSQALGLIEIAVRDYVIVGKTVTSFAEHGFANKHSLRLTSLDAANLTQYIRQLCHPLAHVKRQSPHRSGANYH